MFDFDSVFLITAQSSLILGLIHGINPCGHSWLIIAPFVTGLKNGKKVFLLTSSFLLGTTIACLFIGLTLGSVSAMIPKSFSIWVDYVTAAIIIVLGLILLVKPDLLHKHDHDHSHEDGDHHHSCSGHCHHDHGLKGLMNSLKNNKSVSAMFLIGFINMIIPCPTVAIMYKYAMDSASYTKATAIFGVYAVATAIAVGGVIFAIYKTTNALYALQKEWIESVIMRTAGLVTLIFGIWTLL